ncbi:MAG: hypothetical protein BGO10_10700 [Chlamydia sp. 32-24]|nr:MAG: hypothetical protein BGO10_10700 [Chlamydia sp. 32-24]
MNSYKTNLLIFFNVCFSTVVIISNILSAKMTHLPIVDFSIPAGSLTYPLTFFITGLVTEIYGAKQAKLMVYNTFAMSIFTMILIYFVIKLPHIEGSQSAFEEVMGLSHIRIFSSLSAYLISQTVDIRTYAYIKKLTGDKFLWLRNNGSIFLSQFIDTMVVDLIYLYWGLSYPLSLVFLIALTTFFYKITLSFLTTPLFYFFHFITTNKKIIHT